MYLLRRACVRRTTSTGSYSRCTETPVRSETRRADCFRPLSQLVKLLCKDSSRYVPTYVIYLSAEPRFFQRVPKTPPSRAASPNYFLLMHHRHRPCLVRFAVQYNTMQCTKSPRFPRLLRRRALMGWPRPRYTATSSSTSSTLCTTSSWAHPSGLWGSNTGSCGG